MMFSKSIVFLLVATKASGLGLNLRGGDFFDNVGNDAVEESPEQDKDSDRNRPGNGGNGRTGPRNRPGNGGTGQDLPPDEEESPEEDEQDEEIDMPMDEIGMPVMDAPVMAPRPPDQGLIDPTMPAPPVLPPPEDPKGEFILKIAKEATNLESIINDFKAKNPGATIKGTYTSELFGFAVDGVTETEVKMFANSCSNLVLDIFSLFQAGNGGGPAGAEGNGCIAKPPSGTITMEVVYDMFAYETRFSLWQLNGVNWEIIGDYAPPTTFPMDRQVVTTQLADGEYTMDVVDLAHNGMATPGSELWGGYNGHFALIETDSGVKLYEGAEFGTFVSLEFKITNGEVKLTHVKSSNTPLGYYY
jgi:hypothetical protein